MTNRVQRQAIEQLREQVRGAAVQARGNHLWSMDLETKRELAREHVEAGRLGTNVTGWKNPYPQADPRSMLYEYQFAYFHDLSRFKLMLASRQTGKDFTSEGEIADDCHTRPTEWMIAAPSERQALDSLDQGKVWSQAFDLMVEDYVEEREGGPQTLLKSAEILFSNGSRVRAVPGRPDTVRGRSANVLLTEFDFFDNPPATWRAILPSITNPLRGGEKKIRAVSTPNGKDGQMYRLYEGEKSKGKRVDWSRHRVTIYDAVLMGLPTNWLDLEEMMDDAEGWAQEFEVQFIDSSGVLLPYELIQQCESYDASTAIPADFWTFTSGRGPVVCGIDFGRLNDPSVCWTLELVGDVWWTREVLVMDSMPTPQQYRLLLPRMRRANRVCLDYTGPGIGLGDLLVEACGEFKPTSHKFGLVELCTFSSSFKCEIFPRLRSAMSGTKIRVPVDITTREDLHAMRQHVNAGRFSYDAPRTKDGHSDRCTALALALRASGTATAAGRPFVLPKSKDTFTRTAARRIRGMIG